MELFKNKECIKGVYYLSEKKQDFEEIYLKVREKENRVYADTDLLQIPFVKKNFPNYQEWLLRQESAKRFAKYLQSSKNQLILEIGCGNGWLLNYLAERNPKNTYIGLDMNTIELEQAAKVFKNTQIYWVYGDITKPIFLPKYFQVIYIASSIQYFENFDELIKNLFLFLKPKGQIHIFDSPFYKKNQRADAQQRTIQYYTQLGFPAMANFYHHHTWENLQKYQRNILYRPTQWNKCFKISLSPFPWVRITPHK